MLAPIPPTTPRLLVALARALAIGALAGLIVGWLAIRTFGLAATPARLLYSAAIGIPYALALAFTEKALGRWLRRVLPLRSRAAVAVHVAVQAVAALAAFILVTVALRYLAGVEMPFAVEAFIALLAVGITSVSHGVSSLLALHERMLQSERSAGEAELRALRAQINPHFLFNSLNSIAALIRSRPAEAEAVTENLAELFRYSLQASRVPTVRLADELASVETYLAIELARFRDRLQFELVVPEELRRAQVPSLVLQPLVENAVKHGMQQSLEECRIELRAERRGDAVAVVVSDTGPGFASTDLETVLGRGTGLANVLGRLRHSFGERAALAIQAQGVELRFPLVPVADDLTAAERPRRAGADAGGPRSSAP